MKRVVMIVFMMVLGVLIISPKAEAKYKIQKHHTLSYIRVTNEKEMKKAIEEVSEEMLKGNCEVERYQCKNRKYETHYCGKSIVYTGSVGSIDMEEVVRKVEIKHPEYLELDYAVSFNSIHIVKTEVDKETKDKMKFYEKMGNHDLEDYYKKTYQEHPTRSYVFLKLSKDLRKAFYETMFGFSGKYCEYCDDRYYEEYTEIRTYYKHEKNLENDYRVFAYQNPQFYFLDSHNSQISKNFNRDTYNLRFFYTESYKDSAKKVKKLEPTFYETMKKYKEELHISKSDSKYNKILKINNFVCQKIQYESKKTIDGGYLNETRALGRLAKGNNNLVCVGFAKFFQALCGLNDVPCITVCSRDHCWNLVEYNGNKYMVDCTFNDYSGVNYCFMNVKTDSKHSYKKEYNIIAD